MAGSDNPQPNKPKPPNKLTAEAPRKPLQVIHISKREEQEKTEKAEGRTTQASDKSAWDKSKQFDSINNIDKRNNVALNASSYKTPTENFEKSKDGIDLDDLEGVSMADLLGKPSHFDKGITTSKSHNSSAQKKEFDTPRSVDDFDFDEDAFLAALDENEPIGSTGEVAIGSVIAVESDGVYVDIGGKAPGFMPKNECGLGVITNLKENFPKGLKVEVLVTREQNADGIVTISCRALALRKSWEKVQVQEKEGKVVQVKVNGFNRGGVTCDLDGLRGFIPRSQLENGENHESLVGKTLGVAFIEVNPDTRKLVLSEKRAATATRFAQLEVGQLIEGQIVAIKPYGFFVDLGGVSGLLHHSMVTNGSLRSLREVFVQGERIKAMITELDPGRCRIALNTALLEGPPGELLIEKEKVMAEAAERAIKARNVLSPKEQTKEDVCE